VGFSWSPYIYGTSSQRAQSNREDSLRHGKNPVHLTSDYPTPKITFSQELRELAEQFADRPVAVGEILERTKGRGMNLLLILISLPFLTPIPLPGFSIPFGLVAAIVGARMALGQKPWLPQKLLTRRLPPRFLSKLLKASGRVVKSLEYLLRPRLAFMNEQVAFRRLAGALIAASGLFLIIPLPVPFSNSLPACTILLLAAGALEEDGLALLLGCGVFLLTAGFFLLLALGGAEAAERLRDVLG
jgi:hypothetical protein